MQTITVRYRAALIGLAAGIMSLAPLWLPAAELRVAVASNFAAPMQMLATRFEAASQHRLILIPGSTGKLYAQIGNGAPFDLFFAADAVRPALLEKNGDAIPGTRFAYALGRLVLWSPNEDYVDRDGGVLERGDYRFLAIANPRLAPYGAAAREVLVARELWDELSTRVVRGENVAQAFQFVASGNAELGFVARAQLARLDPNEAGSRWDVPPSLHSPITQQAVLLRDSRAAREFIQFVKSPDTQSLLADFGYDSP